MLARHLEIDEVIVGKGIYLPDGVADDAPASTSGAMTPSSPGTQGLELDGPQLRLWLPPQGIPHGRSPWYDRDIKSWKYPTTVERRPYLVGADAGFLFQSAVPAQA